MDYAGVEYSVLHVNPIMGLLNDYVVNCVRSYPDRLLGLASVKEWEIEKDPEGQAQEVERVYNLGLHGLQFIVNTRFFEKRPSFLLILISLFFLLFEDLIFW